VGLIYSLFGVRSPAPPIVALVGLLGMLVGEQILPISGHILAGAPFVSAMEKAKSAAHLFGELPGRHARPVDLAANT